MMGGIIGQYFISFGLTIVVTVLISLAVARMITPMMAAYFLKAKGQAKHGEGWLMDRYMGLLRWTLVHRWKTVAVGAALLRRADLRVRDPALHLPAQHRRGYGAGRGRDAAGRRRSTRPARSPIAPPQRAALAARRRVGASNRCAPATAPSMSR